MVTDDTVEVKVVERAQQKLKLDAMVVQQGRLGEKEKKMTKDDLLDTLRFGADSIFRSKESTITDADIDLILLEGKKRTEEMNDKMKVNEKGDMYDFSLDGGSSTQIFEGKDYSDKTMRDQEKENPAGGAFGIGFIDTGKRERKTVNNYMDGNGSAVVASSADAADKKPKLPRHLRIPPRMDDWQFYDKSRLVMLQEEELRLFDEMAEKGELPSSGTIRDLVLLTAGQHEEKTRLLAEGFASWTRNHFTNFVKASSKYGRTKYGPIAQDVGRPEEEV
jgi:SWI/SNF-related matrix-associated actin-dependent regulator of chromatin subfamily A member 5